MINSHKNLMINLDILLNILMEVIIVRPYLVNTFVELWDYMTSGGVGKLRIEDTNWYAKLFQVELDPVALVHRVDEDDWLPSNQLQFEKGVH